MRDEERLELRNEKSLRERKRAREMREEWRGSKEKKIRKNRAVLQHYLIEIHTELCMMLNGVCVKLASLCSSGAYNFMIFGNSFYRNFIIAIFVVYLRFSQRASKKIRQHKSYLSFA